MKQTYVVLFVCLVEELLQQLGPEFIQHLFQVDVRSSIILLQIDVEVREELRVVGVHGAQRPREALIQVECRAVQQLHEVTWKPETGNYRFMK